MTPHAAEQNYRAARSYFLDSVITLCGMIEYHADAFALACEMAGRTSEAQSVRSRIAPVVRYRQRHQSTDNPKAFLAAAAYRDGRREHNQDLVAWMDYGMRCAALPELLTEIMRALREECIKLPSPTAPKSGV